MPRVLRIAGSLAIVLVAYWTYALVAVPLIEPPADPRRDRPISEAEQAAAEGRIDAGIAALAGLFPPGAWELKSPKILESDQVKLLMEDYRNLGDGRVEIHPCTMIFTPDGSPADQARRNRQAVVLEAPEGALLEFDQPLDLRRMKIGRLVGGQLLGRITIRSAGKRPGPEDDLLIVTRDVELTEQNVSTAHPVDFHYGPHYGRGSHMQIKLLPGEKPPGADRRELNIAGIESFELRHVERLHLELGKLGLASDDSPATPQKRVAAADGDGLADGAQHASVGETPAGDLPGALGSDLPIEVTCQGPFRFDAIDKVATFEDQVSVLRINPVGPSDQLNCELLSVLFTDPAAPTPNGPNGEMHVEKNPMAGSTGLQPRRIEARGDPVALHAPSERLHARGERLEYDLQTGRTLLEGTREVMLRQEPNEIHARSLQYQPAGPGRLGRITAEGAGWLRGRMDQRPDQQLQARWNKHLRVRPYENNQVISLTGGAGLKLPGIGQLDAPEIHLYLSELPQAGKPGRYQLRPDRMLAGQEDYLLVCRDGRLMACREDGTLFGQNGRTLPRRNVQIDSPQLAAAVEQLEVWFEHVAKGEGGRQTADGGSGTAAGDGPWVVRRRPPAAVPAAAKGYFRRAASGHPSPPVADHPPSTLYQPVDSARGPPRPVARRGRFQIVGRLLRARVLGLGDTGAELSELLVQEGVEFAETRTSRPRERPLLVRGNRLHVVDASKPHAAVTISGQPAHFRGRGLALSGPSINLNRGTNRLWIDRDGRMDLAMNRDLEGRPLRNPVLLRVHWQDRMVFDGRTARFEGSVTATAPHRELQTETLEVELKRPIDFSDEQIQQDPEVQRLLCRGGVVMENLSFDDQGTQTSHERMQAADLTINLDSGALTAGGPGWLSSVRRGSDRLLTAEGGGPSAGAPPRSVEPAGPRHPGPGRNASGNRMNVKPPRGRSGQGPDRAGRSSSPLLEQRRLRGLHVRFQGSLTGNVHRDRRKMVFHKKVDTAYARVDSWQAVLDLDDPDALGPGGALMHCDRLAVHQMPAPQTGRRNLELAAEGNVVVEGNAEGDTFTARAVRMTYAEAKNLLILEGDGRTDAELFLQQQIGGPTAKHAAQKISYWPKTKSSEGRLKIEGARSLRLDRFPTGGQRKPH